MLFIPLPPHAAHYGALYVKQVVAHAVNVADMLTQSGTMGHMCGH